MFLKYCKFSYIYLAVDYFFTVSFSPLFQALEDHVTRVVVKQEELPSEVKQELYSSVEE
jgi:hypothetical protein